MITILFIIGALISYAIIYRLRIYLLSKNVLDIPNERSSHTIPTPRGGGIGITLTVIGLSLIYCIFKGSYKEVIFLLICSGMATLGWIDDRVGGLSSSRRFVIQILLASFIIALYGGIQFLPFPSPLNISLGIIAIPVSIIWIVVITNIYNFMDGIDGIAGTQGVVAGLSWYFYAGETTSGVIGLIIAGGCAGFLLLNWHPAKIFMGDVGSAFLGFIFAGLPFISSNEISTPLPFYSMAIFLWFFLLDGSFTMIRRILKREKIWEAHRTHIYQRLTQTGLKHSSVVLLIIGLYMILIPIFFYQFKKGMQYFNWTTLLIAFILFISYLTILLVRNNRLKKSVN